MSPGMPPAQTLLCLVFLFSALGFSVAINLEKSQVDFLRDFSKSLGSTSPWNIPAGDSTAVACSSLTGIDCYADGSIAAMKLSSKQLQGSIPESIGALSSLWSFDLRFNNIDGPIPAGLTDCKNLQYIFLSHNQLSGEIPANLGNKLILMTWIYLDYNQLSGPIPDSIGKMTFLSILYLGGNMLSGNLPVSLGRLSNLNTLDVGSNQLTGAIPSEILAIKKLKSFTFGGDYFTGTKPKIPASITTISLDPNCWSDVKDFDRNALCPQFCGTMTLLGACNENGRCFINGTSNLPMCDCFDGYTVDINNKDSCIPILKFKVGFIPSNTTVGYFNPYSRHVSYRYNVAKNKWFFVNDADWTFDAWGVRFQGECSSCWAMAAVSAFENLAYIYLTDGNVDPTTLYSVQQAMTCNRLSAQANCAGGWPEAALEYISSRNGGMATEQDYPYTGMSGTCNKTAVGTSLKPFGSVFFEKVDFFGWFGVLIALQQQPLIGFVTGSYPTFQNYELGVYNDPDCFSSQLIDHSVVLMGYELKTFTPYWILRNSWGIYWGMLGDMKMAITGGQGVCGLHTLPALYPVISGPKPCDSPINPCGGGVCIPIKGTAKNWCQCPGDIFVNVTNIDGTQTCALKDVCSTFFYNPCGSGTCLNDLSGGYNCICPAGYNFSSRTDGTPTCAWNGGLPIANPLLVKVPKQATCPLLYSMYGLTRAQFLKQNPKVVCSSLKVNSTINVTPPSGYKCTLWYSWQKDDKCTAVLKTKGISATNFAKFNPGIGTCVDGAISTSQQICISVSPSIVPLPFCTQKYQMLDGDTCASVAAKFGLDILTFQAMNPGVDCSQQSQGTSTYLKASNMEVCVAAFTKMPKCTGSSRPYLVRRSDTCASIKFYQYKGNGKLLSALNGGFSCADSALYNGMTLCTPLVSKY